MSSQENDEDTIVPPDLSLLALRLECKFVQYVMHHSGAALIDIMVQTIDNGTHIGFPVDCMRLLHACPQVGTAILSRPAMWLRVFDRALQAAQQEMLKEAESFVLARSYHNNNRNQGTVSSSSSSSSSSAFVRLFEARLPQTGCQLSVQPLVHVRLENVPCMPDVVLPSIRSIQNSHYNKLVTIKGTVVRAGGMKMVEARRKYECQKCSNSFLIYNDIEQKNVMDVPSTCPAANCKGTKFKVVESETVCRDYQEIKVQEMVRQLSFGSVPRSLKVVLQDELVDQCRPGSDVLVTGVVARMWEPVRRKVPIESELIVVANNIHITQNSGGALAVNEEIKESFREFWLANASSPIRARDQIIKSICPRLFGVANVKLAICLTVIGGVRRSSGESEMVKTRGESHVLLAGDPGSGKSQILRCAAALSTRSVSTTGQGTTGSGLTCTAVKEQGGEWALEAGALVLADRGLCCIDEFGCIAEADRTTIHEAMEQQTISVAKAGLVSTLNTRCAIIAAMNPVGGEYDRDASLSVNFSMESSLLNRFDLVFLMLDPQDEHLDRKICEHIFEHKRVIGVETASSRNSNPNSQDSLHHQQPSPQQQQQQQQQQPSPQQQQQQQQQQHLQHLRTLSSPVPTPAPAPSMSELWSESLLQCYFHFVKTTKDPSVSKHAEKMIKRYYLMQRQEVEDHRMPATIRTLESIIRLCQAHARLMFREKVLPMDVVAVILLMESSAYAVNCFQAFSMDGRDIPHDPVVFDERNPDGLFHQQEAIVMSRLALCLPKDKHRFFDYASYLRRVIRVDEEHGSSVDGFSESGQGPLRGRPPVIVSTSPPPPTKKQRRNDGSVVAIAPTALPSSSSSFSSSIHVATSKSNVAPEAVTNGNNSNNNNSSAVMLDPPPAQAAALTFAEFDADLEFLSNLDLDFP